MEKPKSEAGRAEKWSVGARSETGFTRSDNQDRMSRVSADFGDVFIVSDGMGGHKGGAAAAEMTVAVLQQGMTGTGPQADVAAIVTKAFAAANGAVYAKAHSGDADTEGMGATALMLVIREGAALVAHVGDSRAYLFRVGKLQRLTVDHTRVQRMIEAGMLTAAEAEGHPDADLLDRAMGHMPEVEVEIGEWLKLKEGDQLLLCSDGLSGYVEDREIEAAMSRDGPVQALVDDLVKLSLAKGGHDNVTVQIVRYGDPMSYMSPGRMMLYQAAFLPLSALVAGITAYAVFQHGMAPSIEALRHDIEGLDERVRSDTASIAALKSAPQPRVDTPAHGVTDPAPPVVQPVLPDPVSPKPTTKKEARTPPAKRTTDKGPTKPAVAQTAPVTSTDATKGKAPSVPATETPVTVPPPSVGTGPSPGGPPPVASPSPAVAAPPPMKDLTPARPAEAAEPKKT